MYISSYMESAENGNSANVDYTMKYDDGSAKSEKTKVLKVDGKWKMDAEE